MSLSTHLCWHVRKSTQQIITFCFYSRDRLQTTLNGVGITIEDEMKKKKGGEGRDDEKMRCKYVHECRNV